MEERNDCALKLGSTPSVDSVGAEALPDNRLADVGSDEKRDTGAKTVALGKQLVEKNNNERSRDELEDEEKTDTRAERARRTVETGKDVNSGLAKSDNQGKELLGSTEKGAVILEAKVDLNKLSTCKQLHDHTRSDDGSDTELHKSTTVGRENDTKPVKRVGRVRRHDTVKRDLCANEENKKSRCCPKNLVLESDLALRSSDLWEDAHERADELEESDWRDVSGCCAMPAAAV